jgi:anti-sigma-K factor RskA
VNHDEIRDLLGAYALDAIDAAEHDAIEEHLVRCETCRAEVDRHRETAAMLSAAPGASDTDLWSSIADRLGEERPERTGATPAPFLTRPAPVADLDAARAGRSARERRSWTVAVVASAAAVVLTLLAGVAVLQERRLDDRVAQLQREMVDDDLEQAAGRAALDPENSRVALRSTGDDSRVQIVYSPDGTGFVVPTKLAALPSDRTYQLWALRGDEAVSAGVLGADPKVVAFSAGDGVDAFAITAEKAGGVAQPTNDPVVLGRV